MSHKCNKVSCCLSPLVIKRKTNKNGTHVHDVGDGIHCNTLGAKITS